jgi:hypothetical protein
VEQLITHAQNAFVLQLNSLEPPIVHDK